jgi:ribosomal protein L30, bacterial/organelle
MTVVKITQVKSMIGSSERQKSTLKSLGLGKINRASEKETNVQILGMIAKVKHLVKVEEVK